MVRLGAFDGSLMCITLKFVHDNIKIFTLIPVLFRVPPERTRLGGPPKAQRGRPYIVFDRQSVWLIQSRNEYCLHSTDLVSVFRFLTEPDPDHVTMSGAGLSNCVKLTESARLAIQISQKKGGSTVIHDRWCVCCAHKLCILLWYQAIEY